MKLNLLDFYHKSSYIHAGSNNIKQYIKTDSMMPMLDNKIKWSFITFFLLIFYARWTYKAMNYYYFQSLQIECVIKGHFKVYNDNAENFYQNRSSHVFVIN
jgi:hypothetical protein